MVESTFKAIWLTLAAFSKSWIDMCLNIFSKTSFGKSTVSVCVVIYYYTPKFFIKLLS